MANGGRAVLAALLPTCIHECIFKFIINLRISLTWAGPTVLGGIAGGLRFRRPSCGGRATGLASSDGHAMGSAMRASDRRQGARDGLATRPG
eukprot:352682-Chlamydomonas_euryale.AAC.4